MRCCFEAVEIWWSRSSVSLRLEWPRSGPFSRAQVSKSHRERLSFPSPRGPSGFGERGETAEMKGGISHSTPTQLTRSRSATDRDVSSAFGQRPPTNERPEVGTKLPAASLRFQQQLFLFAAAVQRSATLLAFGALPRRITASVVPLPQWQLQGRDACGFSRPHVLIPDGLSLQSHWSVDPKGGDLRRFSESQLLRI